MAEGSRRAVNAVLTAAALLGFGCAALCGLGYFALFQTLSLLLGPPNHGRNVPPPQWPPGLVAVLPRTPLPDPAFSGAGEVRQPDAPSGRAPSTAGQDGQTKDEPTAETLALPTRASARALAPAAFAMSQALAGDAAEPRAERSAGGRTHRRNRSARGEEPSGLPWEAGWNAHLPDGSVDALDRMEPTGEQHQGLEPDLADFLRNERGLVAGERTGRSRRSAVSPAAVTVEDPESALRSAAESEEQGVVSGPGLPPEALEGLLGGPLERR